MAKQPANLIPVTKNAPQPAPKAPPENPSIADWVSEGHARLRRMNADLVFLGSLNDHLFSEIVKRDQMITEPQKTKE
jgi:hypothetical protein